MKNGGRFSFPSSFTVRTEWSFTSESLWTGLQFWTVYKNWRPAFFLWIVNAYRWLSTPSDQQRFLPLSFGLSYHVHDSFGSGGLFLGDHYTLWAELPESYDEVSISVYRQKIYEYVYTRYKDVAWQRSPPIIWPVGCAASILLIQQLMLNSN